MKPLEENIEEIFKITLDMENISEIIYVEYIIKGSSRWTGIDFELVDIIAMKDSQTLAIG